MPTNVPPDVRAEVNRVREALRTSVRNSRLSYAQVEEALGMCGGYLSVIFAGKVELRVAHVFGILNVIGIPPRKFLLDLQAEEGQAGEHDAA